jgi:hypothetical protein
MLKQWHKEDVFNALQHRGWAQPVPLDFPQDWYYVGEAWSASRLNKILKLYFVADFGTGFKGTDSIESIAGRLVGDPGEYDLWLHRTRDAKWRSSLIEWANRLSPDCRVEPTPTA